MTELHDYYPLTAVPRQRTLPELLGTFTAPSILTAPPTPQGTLPAPTIPASVRPPPSALGHRSLEHHDEQDRYGETGDDSGRVEGGVTGHSRGQVAAGRGDERCGREQQTWMGKGRVVGEGVGANWLRRRRSGRYRDYWAAGYM